jgi:signal transduction histidine kinase
VLDGSRSSRTHGLLLWALVAGLCLQVVSLAVTGSVAMQTGAARTELERRVDWMVTADETHAAHLSGDPTAADRWRALQQAVAADAPMLVSAARVPGTAATERFRAGLRADTRRLSDELAAQWNRLFAASGVSALLGLLLLPLVLVMELRRMTHRRQVRTVDDAMAEMESARKASERARKEMVTLLSRVSHELRTPMHGVLGTADAVLDADLEPSLRRKVELIRTSGQTMSDLLTTMAEIYRARGQQGPPADEPVDLRALVTSCVELYTGAAERKGVALKVGIDAGVPRRVRGDRGRLLQILGNLVDNAVKYTDTGSVRVELTQLRHGLVRFAVTDTGRGVAAEDEARIFEPFARLSRDADTEGSGLGLPLCRDLAEEIGGRTGLTRQTDGSCFWFEVPLPPVASRRMPEPVLACRVLVVDDVPTNLLVASAMLKRLGLPHDTVDDGAAAVARATEGWDVVLMDLEMPGMDGFEATERILAERPGTRVLALTAHPPSEVGARCAAAGMEQVLSKPLGLQQLREALWPVDGTADGPRP